MAHINIEFTLFSAFYSPLISLMSGGVGGDENPRKSGAQFVPKSCGSWP